MNDTICAISTALGVGAISIIRVSGDEAIDIVNKIFDKDLTKKESHTINYGHIVYNGEIIGYKEMLSIIEQQLYIISAEQIFEAYHSMFNQETYYVTI